MFGRQKPDAKIGFLHRNDDFGKDYLAGARDVLDDGCSKHVVQTFEVSTAPDNYRPIQAMQLQRWNGTTWERFGEVIQGLPA